MKGNWLDRLIELPDQGASIQLGESKIIAVPAHVLHSVGNFQFYGPISKILFSGDMVASMVEDATEQIRDFNSHIPKMKGFHQRYIICAQIV